MPKKILISAGGTATAWHIANTISKKFCGLFEVVVTDIHPKYYIPSSMITDIFYQVPPITSSNYVEYMLNLMEAEKIDIFIPLIDLDLAIFPNDRPELQTLGITSTAPNQTTIDQCSNKLKINQLLHDHDILVPATYTQDEISPENQYFIKPLIGFGSREVRIAQGVELTELDFTKYLVQDVCESPEITVEVYFSQGRLHTICRERLEVKGGVCTKARVFFDENFHRIIEELTKIITLPVASCIQFMRYEDSWAITDLNLRLGAGTALSSCAGWDLTGAALTTWANLAQDPVSYLSSFREEKFIARVYEELVMN